MASHMMLSLIRDPRISFRRRQLVGDVKTLGAGENIALTDNGESVTISATGSPATPLTKAAIEEVLTGPITSHSHLGGGAPDPHAASHQNGGSDAINVDGLSGALADPQPPTAHTHPQNEVTNLVADLDGLVAALDDKSDMGHTHAGVYEPANANIQVHVISAHAPANAQKNSDITLAEIEAKLIGEIASHTHAGGGAHAASHQNGGADEISVAGLSGLLADAQTPAAHSHAEADVTGLVADLALKAPLASPAFTGSVAGITKTMVGLSSVDNTTDAGKPVSTATQTALDGKAAVLGGDDNYVTDAEKVKLGNLSGTNTGDQTLPTDATIATTDVTTNNASTSKHGWMMKYPGGTATFLRADGAFAAPTAAASISQTEIDFGATPVAEASFLITDANVSPSSKLIGTVAYVAPTGKDLDELDMDGLDLKFAPGSGQFTLYARGLDGYVADKFVVNYQVGA